MKKSQKTSYLENLSSHIWRQVSQSLRVPSQFHTTGLRSSKLFNFLNLSFWNIFEKIRENVISRKLQEFEKSYSEARLATHMITLTVPTKCLKTFKISKPKIFENF